MEDQEKPFVELSPDTDDSLLDADQDEIDSLLPQSNVLSRSARDETEADASLRPDVVFIGAGPIGLWTAVQLKLLTPSAEVVMIEKYKVYQRSHVLKLDHTSFRHCVNDARLLKMTSGFPKFIRTNDLEDALLAYATDLGVKFKFMAVSSVDEVIQIFPSASIIVGSDGSHSITRHTVFNNQFGHQEDLQCTVEVKYEAHGEARPLNMPLEQYPLMKEMGFIVTESIGKEKEGRTPVTLRLLVDPQTHASVKDASFKNPFYFPTHKHLLAPKLRDAVNMWLNGKAHFNQEIRVPGSEKLTSLKLSAYRAKQFYAKYNSKDVFLVGDAAFGVPFFRALNNGFLCGTHLAYTLAKLVDANRAKSLTTIGGFFQKAMRITPMGAAVMDKVQLGLTKVGHKVFFEQDPPGYNDYVNALSNGEITLAKTKRNVLKLIKLNNDINAAIPWQVIKFPEATLARFKQDAGFALPAHLANAAASPVQNK